MADANEPGRLLPEHRTLDRSSLVRGALLGATGLFVADSLSSWSEQARARPEREDEHARTAATRNTILLVYFSRAGENYYYGGRRNLKVGNTEVLAGMISKHIRADVHHIRAAQPYPRSYQKTVNRNVREQNADARPRIANPLKSIERYDVVLLGSPIWNVRPPMIMSTFTDSHDFDGKTIYPFVTYAVSGLGTTAEVYRASCPNATLGEGLAVRGERVTGANRAVESWLRRIDLLR